MTKKLDPNRKNRAVIGRPPKYRVEFCEKLVEWLAEGRSYESFASTIDTDRRTLYLWEKQHPEFLQAKRRAFDAGLAFWEEIGTKQATGEIKGNSASWIFNMKNRFKWVDRTESVTRVELEAVFNHKSDRDLLEAIETSGVAVEEIASLVIGGEEGNEDSN